MNSSGSCDCERPNRILSTIALLLIVSGLFVTVYFGYFPRSNDTPKTPTFMFAGPMKKIQSLEVIVIVYLSSPATMQIQYTVNTSEQGVYYFDIWTPFKVLSAKPIGYLVTAEIGSPGVSTLNDGSTWVSVNASLPSLTSTIVLELDMEDLFSIREPGRNTAILTFWGGSLTEPAGERANQIAGMGSRVIFPEVRQFLVFVNFPNDTILSADTFPPPAQLWASGNGRWADWILNFTSPLKDYGKSIFVSIYSPSTIAFRDAALFSGGILLATGAGGAFESVRDYLRNPRQIRRAPAEKKTRRVGGRSGKRMTKQLISGIVILFVTLPIVFMWNVFLGVHLDVQAIYGGTLGAFLGIGLDRLVTGLTGN